MGLSLAGQLEMEKEAGPSQRAPGGDTVRSEGRASQQVPVPSSGPCARAGGRPASANACPRGLAVADSPSWGIIPASSVAFL